MDATVDKPVVWLYGRGEDRARSAGLAGSLSERAVVITLGPSGDPAPALDLGERPDLGAALESCPVGLRPDLLLIIASNGDYPMGADSLPCPRLALADPTAERAAGRVLAAARQGQAFAWIQKVRANVPLGRLLGSYAHLVDLPLNFEGGLTVRTLQMLEDEGPDRLLAALNGRVITSHFPFINLALASMDPLIVEASVKRMTQAARWAVELGVARAVVHTGFNAIVHRDVEDFAWRLSQGLRPVAERLQEAGIPLALENVFEQDPAPLLASREALRREGCDMVGFCLDVGHAVSFSRTGLDEWFDALGPDVLEMHLHDNNGMEDGHLPIGQGVVDWGLVKRRLEALDWRPRLTIEPHRESHLWASLRGLERVWGPPPESISL